MQSLNTIWKKRGASFCNRFVWTAVMDWIMPADFKAPPPQPTTTLRSVLISLLQARLFTKLINQPNEKKLIKKINGPPRNQSLQNNK